MPITATIKRSVLEQALWELGGDLDESAIRSYSGRAMYGDECLGIVMEGGSEIVQLALALERAGETDVADALARGGRTDSMGLRMITYWPSIQLEED